MRESKERNEDQLSAEMLEDNMNKSKKKDVFAAVPAKILSEFGLPIKRQQEILGLVIDLVRQSEQWGKLASITSEGPEDKEAVKIAYANRVRIKKDRNDAEKFLKAKREEVQKKMEEFVKEDKAYLKLFQYFESEAKTHEAKLKEIETAAERYAEEQAKLLEDSRLEKLAEVCDDPSIYPVGTMSEAAFESMYSGLKLSKEKAEEDRIKREAEDAAAALERARLAKEAAQKEEAYRTRKLALADFVLVDYLGKGTLTADTTEEEFQKLLASGDAALKLKQEEDKQTLEAVKEAARLSSLQKRLFDAGMTFNGTEFKHGDITLDWPTISKLDPESAKKTVENHEKIVLAIVAAEREAENSAKVVETIAEVSETPSPQVQQSPEEELEEACQWVSAFVAPPRNLSSSAALEDRVGTIMTKFAGFKAWAMKEVTGTNKK